MPSPDAAHRIQGEIARLPQALKGKLVSGPNFARVGALAAAPLQSAARAADANHLHLSLEKLPHARDQAVGARAIVDKTASVKAGLPASEAEWGVASLRSPHWTRNRTSGGGQAPRSPFCIKRRRRSWMGWRGGNRAHDPPRRSAFRGSPPTRGTSPLSRAFVRRAAAALALLLIVVSLFSLRMMPATGHDVDLLLDAAFNYRMTYLLLKTGAVPAVDTLSTYPEGKEVSALLPTGIYYACAAFNRGIGFFRAVPLTTTVLLFCSLCGALIALPVYFISLELYGSRPIALISATLAGVIPAYLNRTLCYWYRDEILGMPILFLSFLFFLRIFSAPGERKAILNGSISMALLVSAFYAWRLSALFVAVYGVCLLYLLIRSVKNIKRVAIAAAFLVVFYGILLWFIPGFGRKNPGSHYGSFPRAILEINLDKLGLRVPFSDFTRLVADNRELRSVGPVEMSRWDMLSLSAGFPVLFLILYLRNRDRSPERDVVCASVVLFSFLSGLVFRNIVFLAPLAAIVSGESLRAVRDPKRGRIFRYGMLAVCLVLLVRTGLDGYRMASIRHLDTRMGRYLTQALVKVRDLTPRGAAVACYWADGYLVQTYCNRPTLTDGLFESREIVSRILEESRGYYSQDETGLWNYCARHGAGYLLVPVRRTESYARQAGVPYDNYFTRAGPTAAGKATVLFRLLDDPGSLRRFRELYRNPEYILYEVLGGIPPAAGAPS